MAQLNETAPGTPAQVQRRAKRVRFTLIGELAGKALTAEVKQRG
jgi:hypothetical protein